MASSRQRFNITQLESTLETSTMSRSGKANGQTVLSITSWSLNFKKINQLIKKKYPSDFLKKLTQFSIQKLGRMTDISVKVLIGQSVPVI